jgi:PAS domain S-box-containing protein
MIDGDESKLETRQCSENNLRTHAEQRILAGDQPVGWTAEIEINRLVHELQVHQIELEIQNDELRKAQSAAEDSRDMYSSLFELSPLAIISLDSDFRIKQANFAAMSLLNNNEEGLHGQLFSRSLLHEDGDIFHLHCQKARLSGKREECELRLSHEALPTISVELHTVHLGGDKKRAEEFLIVIADMTERDNAKRQVQQAYQELESRVKDRTNELVNVNRRLVETSIELRKLSAAVDQSRSSILITDKNYIVEYANSKFLEFTGYSADEVLGKGLHVFTSGNSRLLEGETQIAAGNEWRATLQSSMKNKE